MSGHSKWTQIKRQKGVADAKRGQAFTKIANAISIAVRQGGGVGDPNQNFRLRLTIEKARSLNMPKENVERAIQRGMGRGGKEQGLEEIVYEGFAPGGVAVMVEVATDNKQRTTPEIKNTFEKSGGILATPGAVAYQFQQKGQITVKKNGHLIDDIFLLAADSGAENVEDAGSEVLVYTRPEELARVKDSLSQKFSVVDAELTRKPTVVVSVTNQGTASKILSLLDRLENLDDVQKVFANFDIQDNLIHT